MKETVPSPDAQPKTYKTHDMGRLSSDAVRSVFGPSMDEQDNVHQRSRDQRLSDPLLESFPPDYAAAISRANDAWTRCASESRALKKIGTQAHDVLANAIARLSPVYGELATRGWEPVVVFVPAGLDFHDWHSVLRGHILQDGVPTRGVSLDIAADYDIRREPASGDLDLRPTWRVAIISGSPHPIYRQVSANGLRGTHAWEAIEAIEGLSDIDDAPSPGATPTIQPDH